MKKVYQIKAERVDPYRGMYAGTDLLRTIYGTKEDARRVAKEEMDKIMARGDWWMDHARNDVRPELPKVMLDVLEVEGL